MVAGSPSRGVHLKVVLEPSGEGGFTVSVPALPGCFSEGDTKAEALRNIREAILLYLEDVPGEQPAGAVIEEIVV